jgi:hypothetical protein
MMNSHTIRVAIAIALSTAVSGALAQTQTIFKSYCHVFGAAMEPIGDRPGHAIQAPTMTCRTEGGPMDGSILSGSFHFEWDGPNAIMHGSIGIMRKLDATAIYSNTGGKTSLIMVDGKVTGATGSGRGTYLLATGSASALNGKGFTYVTKTIGFNQFVIETTLD